jgi:hypothetical protein
VFWLEAAIAPLVFSPWRTTMLRWIAVGSLIALQLGFAAFLWLDTFPMIAGAFALGLVPWPGPATETIVERSRPRTIVAGIFIAFVLALNVLSLSEPNTAVRRPAELLGIDQHWTMFAPSPTRLDGWFLVVATQADGRSIDLLAEQPMSWDPPTSFRVGIRTTRELVYMRRLLAYPEARGAFAESHCRPDIVAIAVYFMPVYAGEKRASELLVERRCR